VCSAEGTNGKRSSCILHGHGNAKSAVPDYEMNRQA